MTGTPLLIKFHSRTTAELAHAVERVATAMQASPRGCFRALADGEIYAYLASAQSAERCIAEAARYAESARRELEASALSLNVIDLLIERSGPGALTASNQPTPFHYVVETDVEGQHEQELNAWYDTEHLPGLASVPGAARARRYRNRNGSPRYLACYDLAGPEVLERPEWLAVRGTEWSARVRPTFRNPKRTMFQRLA